MWPRRRNRAVSAAILLLSHAFAGGHAKRGHDGLARRVYHRSRPSQHEQNHPVPSRFAGCT